MAKNPKVKEKSGRRNPAGLLSFMSRSEKESSKETTVFDYYWYFLYNFCCKN